MPKSLARVPGGKLQGGYVGAGVEPEVIADAPVCVAVDRDQLGAGQEELEGPVHRLVGEVFLCAAYYNRGRPVRVERDAGEIIGDIALGDQETGRIVAVAQIFGDCYRRTDYHRFFDVKTHASQLAAERPATLGAGIGDESQREAILPEAPDGIDCARYRG